jgi:acetolactate synthase-1/2/3 large subunit
VAHGGAPPRARPLSRPSPAPGRGETKRIGPDGLFAVHLKSPDFAAVARAYGAAAFVVEKTAEFADAFGAALAHPGPALVHVKTDRRDISVAGPLPA